MAKLWLCFALISFLYLYTVRMPGCGRRKLRAFDGITSRSSHSHSRRAPGFSTTPLRRSLIRWGERKLSGDFRRIKGQCEGRGRGPHLLRRKIKLFGTPARISAHVSISRHTAISNNVGCVKGFLEHTTPGSPRRAPFRSR